MLLEAGTRHGSRKCCNIVVLFDAVLDTRDDDSFVHGQYFGARSDRAHDESENHRLDRRYFVLEGESQLLQPKKYFTPLLGSVGLPCPHPFSFSALNLLSIHTPLKGNMRM